MMLASQPRVFIALDVNDEKSALTLVEQLEPKQCGLKVGKTLFTALGPRFIQTLIARGFTIFLDLKYHDIPKQVAGACRAASALGVAFVTVHALGGSKMLIAARDALQALPERERPKLFAVTVLTSHSADDLSTIGFCSDVAGLLV